MDANSQRVATVIGAWITIIAINGAPACVASRNQSSVAGSAGTSVGFSAGIRIIASHYVRDKLANICGTNIIRAFVEIIAVSIQRAVRATRDGRSGTGTSGTYIGLSAGIDVIANGGIVDVDTNTGHHAGSIRTRIAIITIGVE
jgi:hypothetical protein